MYGDYVCDIYENYLRSALVLDGFHLLTRFAQGGHGCFGLLLLRRDLRVQQRLAS